MALQENQPPPGPEKKTDSTIAPPGAGPEPSIADYVRELAFANQELEAFTYSVAHDLRAPLRGIAGYLDALREDHGRDLAPAALAYLESGLGCAARLQAMIDDLLTLSRISRHELRRTSVPLGEIAAEAVEGFSKETKTRAIAWRVGELPAVSGDPALLRQLLTCLLSNAVKFTRPSARPEIGIGAELVDGQAAIVVRDNGTGFDMRRAGGLGTPFYRLHAAQDFEGNGIGLAVAQRIVRRHGGRIWLESEPKAGTAAFFTLGTG